MDTKPTMVSGVTWLLSDSAPEANLRRSVFGVSQSSSVSRCQLVSGNRRDQSSKRAFTSESSAQCSSVSGIEEANSAEVIIVIVTCVAAVISMENKSGNQSESSSCY
jgi:hypothetical protein